MSTLVVKPSEIIRHKDYCLQLSDFHVSYRKAQLVCFSVLNALNTKQCENLRLERHLLELLHGLSVFFTMLWDPPGKVLLLNITDKQKTKHPRKQSPKISVSLTCYRHIGSKSTNHSPLA